MQAPPRNSDRSRRVIRISRFWEWANLYFYRSIPAVLIPGIPNYPIFTLPSRMTVPRTRKTALSGDHRVEKTLLSGHHEIYWSSEIRLASCSMEQ
jgi:hypothetical protein